MAVNLTLNDFRNVLGNVNDGNVVFNKDQTGIEKANFGSKFLNLFRNVRTAENNPAENKLIRESLLTAIRNSEEGRVLSVSDMDRIYAALGISTPDSFENAFSAPLSRVAAALKLQPGERLSAAAVSHAVLNMGLIDGKLVQSIGALSAEDYDALLVQAGQMDAESGGGSTLTMALSTLRGAAADGLLEKAEAKPVKIVPEEDE